MPRGNWRAPRLTPKYGEMRNPKSKERQNVFLLSFFFFFWWKPTSAWCFFYWTIFCVCVCVFGFPLQGSGIQEKGGSEDRGAADEAGGSGDRSRREQADRPRHFQTQLFGPAHFCGLVRSHRNLFISNCTTVQQKTGSFLFCFVFRCKKWGVPIEKIYNKTQREKFAWAIDMADEDYEF